MYVKLKQTCKKSLIVNFNISLCIIYFKFLKPIFGKRSHGVVVKRKEPQPRGCEFKIFKFPTTCSEQSDGDVSKASYCK